VDGPPILPEWEQAVQRQIHTLSDAHAGVSLQQQEITEEVIATLEFLLDELILFRQQWARGAFLPARNIGRREEMCQGRDLLAPGQLLQHTVQEGDADGYGDGGQGRLVGA
jgi:hypothetical protein